jgi:phosphatidylethanolamine/phosphatidyl-N-methylethanolamine N-methyltransferase
MRISRAAPAPARPGVMTPAGPDRAPSPGSAIIEPDGRAGGGARAPEASGLLTRFLAEASAETCLRTYERIAPLYDGLDALYERMWKRRLRRRLLRRARGRTLDVGVGTGCNLPHYPPGVEVVGIDLSRRMLERAAQRARALARPVQLAQMNLLQLEFPDHAFDTLVATFVLLCLPESFQIAALRELHRVCKPDGLVLLLDYKPSSHAPVRVLTRCMSPWMRFAFGGRYDARTEDYLAEAGLRPRYRRSHLGDSVVSLVLEPA